MVFRILFLLLIPLGLAAAPVSLRIEWDEPILAGEIIHGTIFVTHAEDDIIEPIFTQKKKELEVTKGSDVLLPETRDQKRWILSSFRFTLPPQEEGIYFFPPISLQHRGREYSTSRIGVRVSDHPQKKKRFPGKPEPILTLEAGYEGPEPLYPGMRGTLVYRIFYNDHIVLTEEDLPLLEAAGFRKIGDIEVKEAESDGISVQQLEVIVEAEEGGTIRFGPSKIGGFVEETEEMLEAVAPAMEVEVTPFPAEGKPRTFSGAVGNFSMEIAPSSPTKVTVGEPISLQATIRGEGTLPDEAFPSILCLPGFAGQFDVHTETDLIRSTTEEHVYTITLRPLAPFVEAIPPISFSYFSPEKREYVTIEQPPLSIQVLGKGGRTTQTVPFPKQTVATASLSPFVF